MEKINLDYNKDLNYEEILNNLKSNKLIKNLINELQLTNQDIINNFDLLNNYAKINKKCLNCNSRHNCDHSTKGHKYELKKENDYYLTDYFTICDFYKDYYIRKNNLVFTTFKEEDLLDDSQKNFVIDNASMLGMDFVKKVISIQKHEKVNGAFLQMKNSKLRLKLINSLSYGLLINHKMSVVKFSDLLKIIKSEFKGSTNSFNIVLESDILLIDGLGNESITTWSRDEILMSLLDNRIQNDKITILCSEFSLEELKKIYKINYNDDVKANQIIDKINEIIN